MVTADITAVIPYYNVPGDLLDRAISSLKKQNIRYIIVDDGSDSEHKRFLEKYKDRVITLDRNMGAGFARYAGYYATASKYVMHFDADDYLVCLPDLDIGDHDAILQKERYAVPENFEQLINKPWAYLSGAIIKTTVALRSHSEHRTPCLFEDVWALASMLEQKAKIKASDMQWYEYCHGREGSISSLATTESREIAKGIIIDRFG